MYVSGACSNLSLPDVRLRFPGRYWCHLGKTSTRVFSPTASSASWASKRCTVLVREQKKCSSRHWDRLSTENINIYVQLLFIATDMFSHCLLKPPHIKKLSGSGKTLVALTNSIISETCKDQTTFLGYFNCSYSISNAGEMSLVIPPLVSIQQQCEKAWFHSQPTWLIIMICQVCEEWGIPYVSLDGMESETICSTIMAMEPPPRVILSTVSRVSQEVVQKQLRRLPICTICLDEVQVDLYEDFHVKLALHHIGYQHRPEDWLGGFLAILVMYGVFFLMQLIPCISGSLFGTFWTHLSHRQSTASAQLRWPTRPSRTS